MTNIQSSQLLQQKYPRYLAEGLLEIQALYPLVEQSPVYLLCPNHSHIQSQRV